MSVDFDPESIPDYELGWLAAILEGEGNFSRTSGGYAGCRIGVKMTDYDVVIRCQEITGVGTVNGPYKPAEDSLGKKPYWTWSVNRREHVEPLMYFLHPLMGQRRQAKIEDLLLNYAKRPVNDFLTCLYGHAKQRTRRCDECTNIRQAKYRDDNREVVRERTRLAQARHRLRVRMEREGQAA